MLRCLLVFLAAVLLCAWLSPSKKLRESALQALDSSLRCGLDSLDAEHTENAEAAAVSLQRRREVSSRSSAVPTSTKRKRVTPFISKKVAASQQFKCAMCGELLQEDWEVDHVLSLQRGGSNDLSNLQALHKRCHAYKNHVEQFRGERTDPRDR